jgi:hypothetical protein
VATSLDAGPGISEGPLPALMARPERWGRSAHALTWRRWRNREPLELKTSNATIQRRSFRLNGENGSETDVTSALDRRLPYTELGPKCSTGATKIVRRKPGRHEASIGSSMQSTCRSVRRNRLSGVSGRGENKSGHLGMRVGVVRLVHRRVAAGVSGYPGLTWLSLLAMSTSAHWRRVRFRCATFR